MVSLDQREAMTSKEIEDRIEKANQDLFKSWLNMPLPAGRSGLRDTKFPINRLRARGLGTGEAGKAGRNERCLVRSLRDLITCPDRTVVRNVAVGHIIAENTLGRADDLPVVIAVGINYYQFRNKSSPGSLSAECRTWLTGPRNPSAPRTWEWSNMYENAREVCQFVSKDAYKQGFHLVISNVFPWVSKLGWGELELSSYCEMILLTKFGFPDPVDNLLQLLKVLESGVGLIIFHGVNCAVPFYAQDFARRIRGKSPLTVLVNNLSYRKAYKNLCILS